MGKWLPETCSADSKINKIVITASSLSFILFTYNDDARSDTNQIHSLVENNIILCYIKPYFFIIMHRWKFIWVHLDLFELNSSIKSVHFIFIENILYL